jgi:hypothetical protein
MAKYKLDIIVSADSVDDANEKIKALTTILKHLKTEEIKKIASVVSNPLQLSIIKAKFL